MGMETQGSVTGGVLYRPGAAADLLLAIQLRAEMSEDMGHPFDDRSPHWRQAYQDYFKPRLEEGSARFFFAFVDDAAIGSLVASVADHYRTALFGTIYGQINSVYVRRAFRRRGIGTALMRHAIAWLESRGSHVVRLRASEEGRLVYEKMGFTSTNEMELRLS